MKTLYVILIMALLAGHTSLAQYQPKRVVFISTMSPLMGHLTFPSGGQIGGRINVDFQFGYVITPRVMAGISGRLASAIASGALVRLGAFGRYMHPLADPKSNVFGELTLGPFPVVRFGAGVGFNHFFTDRVAFETSARLNLGSRTDNSAIGLPGYETTYHFTSAELGIGLLIAL